MKLSQDQIQANTVAFLKRRKDAHTAHTEEAEEQAFEADICIERLTL